MYIHKSIGYGINIRGKKANNTQTYTMTYKKINEHTSTQITYITINLTKEHLTVISLRETVQFMFVMEIKVNTQKIHTVKKKYI